MSSAVSVERPPSQRSSRPRGRPSSGSRPDASRRKTGAQLNVPVAEASRNTTTTEFNDEDPEAIRRRFRDIDDRRYREWNNYQIAQRSDDQGGAPEVVFIDISIGDAAPARVVIELFNDAPITAANFRMLLTGEKGFDANTGIKLDYIDTQAWRIQPGFGVHLGELSPGVSMSADGGFFDDENFCHRHAGRGTVSMTNRGPHTNGSRFFIAFDKTPALDFRQVVFGRIIEGMSVLDAIEAIQTTRNGTPKTPVTISFCGVLSGPPPQRSIRDDTDVPVAKSNTLAASLNVGSPPLGNTVAEIDVTEPPSS
uniref:PPIase cyclophilin-type domain-containing protein n=1 Tax=Neobodo designis TaxID=312471 RepID=A0A7S1W4C6_NEODS|mmetsp:Transcript_52123/g.160564  ORF Transcript_52123/g.160564 Transcript_52123/m.160564 type:complete len:310 (+) Transcript_52123:43-972(+)|eukprot:CAMPEP_0174831064 /NCGR_PEP_ID=MMETSP1114-20130205/2893_1 /TAXON_ID=312471 /ORGANISM="Neobodo designis, Strain CCAP 1951/1" /LENGTH=309 /DNA_ID=CAMNT_0016064885 /DNA_START=37 /DNA_END=966 /DNA_ORIENTATION=+